MKMKKLIITFFLLFLIFQVRTLYAYEIKYIHQFMGLSKLVPHKGYCYFVDNVDFIGRIKFFDSLHLEQAYLQVYDVNAFAYDKSDTLWIASSHSLSFLPPDSTKLNYFSKIDIGIGISSIAVDSNNVKWIASNTGVWSIEGKNAINVFPRSSSIIQDSVKYISVDKLNNKYFVTTNGFYKYDGNNIIFYNSQNVENLQCNDINFIKFDQSNTMYIGTKCGLVINSDHSHYLIDTNYHIVSNNFNDVDFDSSGNVYVGTGDCRAPNKGGGILILSKDNYFINMQLETDEVFSNVSVDEYNNVWYTTCYSVETSYNGIIGILNLDKINFTDVQNKLKGIVLSLYPNPVTDFLYLSDLTANARNYEIYDQLGIKVSGGIIANEIDVSTLPTGIYFVKIENEKPMKFMKVE